MVTFFALRSDVFFTTGNLQNAGLQGAGLACVAFGQTFVLLTAGLDLSVGSTVALVSVVAAVEMRDHGTAVGILAALLAGLAVGMVNGLLVTRSRVAPFIATLGTMSIVSGIALNISGGIPVVGLPNGFTELAYRRWVGIPLPVVVAIVTLLLGFLLLKCTRLGRYVYAIGGNAEAARLSGIAVRSTTLAAYMICALLTAVGGLILTARVASGQPSLGADVTLQSIAAAVVGGVSLWGGRGSVQGAALGVVFVTVLANGLNLLNVSSYTQLMLIGAAMIAAVAWDQYMIRKERAR
jgi:ribose transport system permease protein